MQSPLKGGLRCAARLLLGLLLFPLAPEAGAAVLFGMCALVLVTWVCGG